MKAKPSQRPQRTTSNRAHGHSAPFTYARTVWDLIDGGHLAACTEGQVRVFLALWRHADFKTGACFPSLRRLAEESGIRISSVARALKGLEARKLIRRKRGRGAQKYHSSSQHLRRLQFSRLPYLLCRDRRLVSPVVCSENESPFGRVLRGRSAKPAPARREALVRPHIRWLATHR